MHISLCSAQELKLFLVQNIVSVAATRSCSSSLFSFASLLTCVIRFSVLVCPPYVMHMRIPLLDFPINFLLALVFPRVAYAELKKRKYTLLQDSERRMWGGTAGPNIKLLANFSFPFQLLLFPFFSRQSRMLAVVEQSRKQIRWSGCFLPHDLGSAVTDVAIKEWSTSELSLEITFLVVIAF